MTGYTPKPGSKAAAIYKYIEDHPGTGINPIVSDLEFSWRTVLTTVRRFVSRNLVEDNVDERKHHHFTAKGLPDPEEDATPFITPGATAVLERIREVPGVGFSQLGEEFNYGVTSQIGSLVKKGFVEVRLDGEGKRGFYAAGEHDELDLASPWPWPDTMADDILTHIQANPGERMSTILEALETEGQIKGFDGTCERLMDEELAYVKFDSDGYRTFYPTGRT